MASFESEMGFSRLSKTEKYQRFWDVVREFMTKNLETEINLAKSVGFTRDDL